MVFRIATGVFLSLCTASAHGQPDAAAECAGHLRAIAGAILAYEKDHGRCPPHLSSLLPKHLKEPSVLHCPADGSEGQPYLPYFPPEWRLADPKLPVSYYYMRAETPSPHLFTSLNPARLPVGATLRERMEMHRVNFGDTIPLLHCNHHAPAFRHEVLIDGTVRRGPPLFEYDASVYPIVLRRLHADAADPALLRKNWWLPAVEQYLSPWIASPLAPDVRQRLFLVGELLAGVQHADDQRAAAFTLAARCYDAAGDPAKALAAAGRAARERSDDVFVRFLLDDLGYRASPAPGDPPVESFVRAEMARRHVPGVSFAVMRDGKPLVMKSLGVANVEHASPLTNDSVFRIASPTKTFVACGVMLLAEEGKLSLDDGITKHLLGAPTPWEPIRIRHLLSHTAGLADVWGLPPEQRPATASGDALVKSLAARPLEFAPGTRHVYNRGAVLLGPIIEKATGKPWGDFLVERLFRPIGMTAMRVDDPGAVIRGRVSGYSWDDVHGVHINPPPLAPGMASLPDGGIISSIADLAKWDGALHRGELIKDSTLKEMWTPFTLNDGTKAPYGYGWQMGTLHGHPWVGHYGAGTSSSKILCFPQHGLTVIVLSNLDRGDAPHLADAIAGYYLPAARAGDDADPAATDRLRGAVASLGAGRPDDALFTAECIASIDLPLTRTFYERLGRITAFAPTGSGAGGRTYSVQFEGGGAWPHTLDLAPDGRISSVRVERPRVMSRP
jgi:CubicO group peptidase (beta-lactamase class C family)